MHPADLIDQIRSGIDGRNRAMESLYRNKQLRQATERFILSKGGTKEEAETIFSDAIINLVKNCYKRDFAIKSTLENYFFGVTRNLWFRTLREKQRSHTDDAPTEDIEYDTPEIVLMASERRQFLSQLLNKLDQKCREVLTMWSTDMKMQSIAKQMSYSSPEVVRKKKHFCLKKLIAIVHEHPEISEALKSNW